MYGGNGAATALNCRLTSSATPVSLQSNVVVRGAGINRTVLYFPDGLKELYGKKKALSLRVCTALCSQCAPSPLLMPKHPTASCLSR